MEPVLISFISAALIDRKSGILVDYVFVQKPPPYQNGHFNWHNGIAKTRQTEKWTGKGEAYIVSRNYQDRSIAWIAPRSSVNLLPIRQARRSNIESQLLPRKSVSFWWKSVGFVFVAGHYEIGALRFFGVSSSGEGLLMSGDFRCGCLKKKQQDFDEKRSTGAK